MTSPVRISVRCRDSSKRAAKDSDILDVAKVPQVKFFEPHQQCANALRERADEDRKKPFKIALRRLLNALPPVQHLIKRLFNR
jgi:hypothetical protein